MFCDYFNSVKESYNAKRQANELSPLLLFPTAAKLKQECIDVCKERFMIGDLPTLRAFFGHAEDKNAYLKLIEKSDPDIFKPLVNFLKEKTSNTEHKNIELLAWLINFKSRPFKLGKDYESDYNSKANSPLGESLPEADTTEDQNSQFSESGETSVAESKDSQTRFWQKRRLVTILLLTLAAGSLFLVAYLSSLKQNNIAKDFGSCMYWAGDHYEPISCNADMPDSVLIVALDSTKLTGFRLITKIDTITMYSLGRLWYLKRDNKVEFYTMGGRHPVFVNERLKRATPYIINKYIIGISE